MDMDGRARNRTAPPDHVDLEDLAALIDGQLAEGDCSRVRAHLAECAECYEIFVDVVRFQEAEAAAVGEKRGGESGGVTQFPLEKRSKAFSRSWLAAAAAAALVMTVGWLGYRQMTPPSLSAAGLMSSFGQRVSLSWLWQEVRLRGGDLQTKQENASVGLGVQVVDLHVALARSSHQEADEIHRTILNLSSQVHFAEHEEIEGALRSVQEARADREIALLRLEGALRESALPVHFDFGLWAEASRLAAIANERAFFKNRSNRRALIWLARQDDLEDHTRRALDELKEPWKKQQFEQIATRLDHLINAYYPRQRAVLVPERLNPSQGPLLDTPPSVPSVPDTSPLAGAEAPPPPAPASAAAGTPALPARRSASVRETAAPRTRSVGR